MMRFSLALSASRSSGWRYAISCLAMLSLAVNVAAASDESVVVAAFSSARPAGPLPAGWLPLAVRGVAKQTEYALVSDDGVTVLRAQSRAAASGVSRKLRIEQAQFPWLRWRWKITNTLAGGALGTRAGDDFPARIYVMFDYPIERLPFAERTMLRLARSLHDPDLPAATLCYVWDGKAPEGAIVPSAYSNRVRLVVVESGGERVNQWVNVERNLVADFKAAFGEEPPAIVAVAVATDTDNTGEAATAFFGDISLHKRALNR